MKYKEHAAINDAGVIFQQAVAHFQQKNYKEAESLTKKFLKKTPNHPDANLLLALLVSKRGKFDLATNLITKSIKSDKNNPVYFYNLGLAYQSGGHLKKALRAYKSALDINPDMLEAYNNCGNVLRELGRLDEAVSACEQVIQRTPENAVAHNNLGCVFNEIGRHSDAVASCERAIQLEPAYADAYYNLGQALHKTEHLERACASFKTAIKLKPDFAEAYSNLGFVLHDMGHLEDALAACSRAIELDPDMAEAYNNYGNVLRDLGRIEEALQAYEKAIHSDPDMLDAHVVRSDVLLDLGRLTDSISACDKVIQLKPDHAEAHAIRGNVLNELGRSEEDEHSYRRALKQNPRLHGVHSNLLFMLSAGAQLPPERILEEHRAWDILHGKEGRKKTFSPHSPDTANNRRLRIGYVSPDFREHSVNYFFEPLLSAHDRTAVEVFCYDTNTKPKDAATERLIETAEHWRSVARINDEELAKLVHEDKIDILIDLAGHTANNRLKAFTYKPAPIQATYLGYFCGTGLESMDYWITDEALHPLNTKEQTAESLYRLPRCWVCYQPPAMAPEVADCPHHDEQVVFGSFSNLSKLTPDVYKAWSRILHKLPKSKLLVMDKSLGDPKTRELVLERFTRHGVIPDQLIIRKGVSYTEYLSTYATVDIVLDSFPRTGGTTTAEALWMGVPVITLAGNHYVERISTSKLMAMGLDDLIGHTHGEYIDIAVSLAHDADRRRRLRRTLRGTMRASPLCDSGSLASAMEAAFMDMWQKQSAGTHDLGGR